MNFIKKQSIGFYLSALTAILALIGVICYGVNTKTNYFINYGVDSVIVACTVIAIICEVVYLAGAQVMKDNTKYLSVLAIVGAVLLMVAFVFFVNCRVDSIASIMTFEKNDNTMADLSSAIVGLVFYFIAMVVSVVASFFKIVKENK